MPDSLLETTTQTASASVQESADKLERHIRACGLKPGDRYITTEEAGKLLGRSIVIAQKAMTLLAQRKILERRPKAGTFIGKAVEGRTKVANIHFLLPEECRTETETRNNYWEQIEGIRAVLGPLSAHFHFIPNQDLNFTQQIIQQASAANYLNGVVLVLASRAMRDFFNESGIPTVVEGGVEPDLTNLCWVQWNQTEIGNLLTAHLLECGHRRFVTIMRDVWSMGEPLLHDGINNALAAAGLPSNALRIRSIASERPAVIQLVRGLLLEESPPTAFICRTEFQADCVAEAARSLQMEDKVAIGQCNPPSKMEDTKYPCVLPEVSIHEFGCIVGEMFKGMLGKNPPETRGREISMYLRKCP